MKKQRYNLKQGLQELRAFLKELAENAKREMSFQPARMFASVNLGGVVMDHKESRQYERILQKLSPDDGVPRHMSRATVDSLLQECILTALNDQHGHPLEQRIEAATGTLREKLKAPIVEWEVWQPVEGLKVGQDGFQFGKAFFCSRSHELAREARNRVIGTIESRRNSSSGAFTELFWPKQFDDLTLCRIPISACDKNAAKELAAFELDATLAVLNFFASVVFPVEYLPLVSLPGEFPTRKTDALVLGSESISVGSAASSSNRVPVPLDINTLREEEVLCKAMDKASALLRDEGEEEYRDRLVTAMKWAGKGATINRREDAFLFYSIALEALLLGGKHDEQLSYRLRLRAAHLLGSSVASRTFVRDKVNDLYTMRSKIVHTGNMQIPGVDLKQLRRLTCDAIIHLLTDSRFNAISTGRALDDWFEHALIGGPDFDSPINQ